MYWKTLEGRHEEGGINWIWYYTDTKEDAEKWYEELTGSMPKYESTISYDQREVWVADNETDSKIKKCHKTEWQGYAFRLHR